MNIYKPGSEVTVADKKCVITSICIYANEYVTYRVTWYIDGHRQEEWIQSFEVEGKWEDKSEIGYI
jgi:hypothetical protein